jgi:adhesin transport system outer membrane protein
MGFAPQHCARALIAGLVATAACACPAAAMTLEEAVRLAVEAHPKVQGAVAGVRAAEAEIGVERSSFFPVVDIKGAAGHEDVDNSTTRGRAARTNGNEAGNVVTLHKEGAVTAQQVLFDGFDGAARTDAARKRREAAEFQVIDAAENIGLKAAQAYIEVIRTLATVRLAEENLAQHAKVLENVRLKAEIGAAGVADVLQAQNRLIAARTRIVQFRGAVRDADARFVEAVGAPADTLASPSDLSADLADTADAMVRAAVSANPSLIAAQRTFQSRESDEDSARSAFWPTLSLEVSGTRRQDTAGVKDSEIDKSALVVMRYNLFHGGRDQARLRRAAELKAQALQKEAELRRQVEQQVRADYSAYLVMQDNLPILREKLAASTAVVEAYQMQFDIGRRSLIDLLDAKDDLFQARVSLLNAEYGLLDAQYRLLADSGALLPALAVSPTLAAR